MTTRIDRRFADLKKEGRAALVTFLTAGDPDYATSLAILKNLPAAGADVIELGMPFTDPMADGPAIQASSQRALKGGQTLKKTLELIREFRKGDEQHADRADGLLQSDLHLRRRQIPGRCEGGRCRRLDRGRSSAGGRQRAVPARAQGRPEFHPPRDADDRRQAASGRAREHIGLCLLRLDHRHYRHRGAECRARHRRGGAHQAAYSLAGCGRFRRA